MPLWRSNMQVHTMYFKNIFTPLYVIPVQCAVLLSTMGVTFLCQWAIKNSPCQKVGFDPLYYHSGRSTHRSHHFNFLLLKTSRYASWIMSCTISQFYSTPHWCVLPYSCLVSYCNGRLISKRLFDVIVSTKKPT